jgi:hypothetical protein
MTFVAQEEKIHCFIACDKDKVNAGHCHCINRIRSEAMQDESTATPTGEDVGE